MNDFGGHVYQGIGRSTNGRGKCQFCEAPSVNGYTPTVDGRKVGSEVLGCAQHSGTAAQAAKDQALRSLDGRR